MREVTKTEIKENLSEALFEFIKYDAELLELGVDERAITHHIACYLKKSFPDWHVDCEYNRKGNEIKKIPNYSESGHIRPDIIVHHRKTNDNLLVIEVKKEGADIFDDNTKLTELTDKYSEYNYKFGILLILPLIKALPFKCKWYLDGKSENEDIFELERENE